MLKFKYKARNAKGEVVSGILEAESQKTLLIKLQQQKLLVTSTEEIKEKVGLKKLTTGKVNPRELLLFTRQLTTLVKANIPLDRSLDTLIQQLEEGRLRNIIKQVKQDVEKGLTLSDALAKHAKVFSPLYISMVKSGEASGNLDVILERLFGYMEKADALRRKIKAALTYPAIVTFAAILIVIILIVFVVPKFSEMFADSNISLPLPTKILFTVGTRLLHNFLWIIIGLGALVMGINYYLRTERGKWEKDRLMLKLPIIGKLMQKVALSRFTTTLGTLIASGVPILESLGIVSKAAGNRIIEKTVEDSRVRVREGEKISEVLKASPVFPPLVTQMISVGEQSGSLGEMLAKIGEFYDEEVSTAVEVMTAAIEPILIIFIGAIVGGIVLSIFMPIFKMATVMG